MQLKLHKKSTARGKQALLNDGTAPAHSIPRKLATDQSDAASGFKLDEFSIDCVVTNDLCLHSVCALQPSAELIQLLRPEYFAVIALSITSCAL